MDDPFYKAGVAVQTRTSAQRILALRQNIAGQNNPGRDNPLNKISKFEKNAFHKKHDCLKYIQAAASYQIINVELRKARRLQAEKERR